MQYQIEAALPEPQASGPITAQELADAASAFREVSPRLFAIAYRNVRSVRDAEDLVQEAWIRWQSCDRSKVIDAKAYLATVTRRLCMDAAKSARCRYETCVATVPDQPDESDGPDIFVEHRDEVWSAISFTLEKLSASERVAFVLRVAFDYSYGEIAALLHRTEASIRQLVRRARKNLAGQRRTKIDTTEQRRIVEAFRTASRSGHMTPLERLLVADLVKG